MPKLQGERKRSAIVLTGPLVQISAWDDHKYVALTQLIEKPMEFGPVPASAGGLLPIDAFATGGLERRHLGGGVLIVGGDSGVADLHCTKVSPIESVTQYLFATREAPQINVVRTVAKPDVCARGHSGQSETPEHFARTLSSDWSPCESEDCEPAVEWRKTPLLPDARRRLPSLEL